jgi:hypothetical protein
MDAHLLYGIDTVVTEDRTCLTPHTHTHKTQGERKTVFTC